MALIKCTECGKEVSSTANKCPHCGTWAPKGKGKAAAGCVVPMVFLILLVAWAGGAFKSGDLPRSEATFEQVDDEVGCGSKHTESKRDHLFETKYKNHRMTWRGKVLSAESNMVSLNMNKFPGSELDVYFSDKNAVHALEIDDEITVDFSMDEAGGCFSPYVGRSASIISKTRNTAALSIPPVSKQADSPTMEKTITMDNQFGCIEKNDYEKIVGYATGGDKDAFMNSLAGKISNGRCTMFNRGDEVFLTEAAILSGAVRLRRKGKTTEYWTAFEAVR